MNETQIKMASVPAWCNFTRVPDPETLVVLHQELEAAGFYKLEPPIEDSRTGQKIIIEAALLFDEQHASDDPYYWGDKDFLEEVEIFAQKVMDALREAGADFYNDSHHTMYGKAKLEEVMGMREFNVVVQRTETRETTITVSAMTHSDAEHMALDQAGDVDFSSCMALDPEYSVRCTSRWEEGKGS